MTTDQVIRTVPQLPWNRVLPTAALLCAVAFGGWEAHCRANGYTAGLDDTADLWAQARRQVRADSTVIVGSSRALFGLDLDVLQQTLGKRPVQLCMVGSNPLPVLFDLVADESFRGDLIVDLVPSLLLVPEHVPPYQNAVRAVEHSQQQSLSQRIGHELSLPLENTFACLQQEDLTLAALLGGIAVPDRDGTQVPPALPPFFYTTDADRRARMIAAVQSDDALRERIQQGWLRLFTPPPPPKWIDPQAFGAGIGAMIDARFAELQRAVEQLRARGCRIAFVRMPSASALRELEAKLVPRAVVWDRALRDCQVAGVHFEDHAELAGFVCPEWSHLTDADAAEFTRLLAPHLQAALGSTSAGAVR